METVKAKFLYLITFFTEDTDSEHGLTMPQIIDKLHAQGIRAERKALYRDIAVLREHGYDIRKANTAPVEYRLYSRDLSYQELLEVIDAIALCPELTAAQSEKLIKKFKGFCSRYQAENIKRKVFVSGRPANAADCTLKIMDTLSAAINKRRKVSFTTFHYDKNLEPVVDNSGQAQAVSPIQIFTRDGVSYLAYYQETAQCIEACPLKRIHSVNTTEEKFSMTDEMKHFSPASGYASYLDGSICKEKTITLRVSGRAVDKVIDRFGKSFELVSFDDAGSLIKVLAVEDASFYGWLCSLGTEAVIAEPSESAAAYKDYLRSLL